MQDTDRTEGSDTGPDPRDSKIGRVIERYGLDGLDEELERRWTGEGDDRYSLRDLADQFNRRVLRAAMREANLMPLDGEVENTYRLLTSEDISDGMRLQTRKRLERDGVDVDAVESHFVSHQAIYTYLKKYRGAQYDAGDGEENVRKDTETIRRLESRLSAVAEQTLGRHRNADRITLGEFDVITDVQVFCEDCGANYRIDELLERGGCRCA